MVCTAGFSYYLKNKKRGWTGIWYGQTRASNNTGTFHSSYNNFTPFNIPDNSVTVDRTYNTKVITAPWNNDFQGALLWANQVFSGMWAYMTGTSSCDVCGPKSFAY